MAKTVWLAVGASLCLILAYWCYVPLPPGSEMSEYGIRALAQFFTIPSGFVRFLSKRQAVLIGRATFPIMMYLLPLESHPLIEDLTFDGVPVRVFGKRALPGVTYPAVVHFHGSGWISGSVDLDHPILFEFWNETNIVFISVEYRLAPEHLFPAAFDDGRRAVLYLLKHASRFHVDPNRISVAGASSGANIAAAVALWWRDEKITPPLSHQILGCPPLQAVDFNTRSYREYAETPLAGMGFRHSMCAFWLTYLLGDWTDQEHADALANKHVDEKTWDNYVSYYDSSQKTDAGQYKAEEVNEELVERLRDKITDPYAAPLAADNLRDLPRTLLLYGETDVLRTDAELYAHRLREDGVNVTSVSPKNSFHCDYGFGTKAMGPFRYSIAIQNLKEYIDYLKMNVN